MTPGEFVFLFALVGICAVGLVVTMEHERQRMRAWWVAEQQQRKQIDERFKDCVADKITLMKDLAEASGRAAIATKWAEHLLTERAEIDSLVRTIHQQVKRGKDTRDHGGVVDNLRCILDHVAEEAAP